MHLFCDESGNTGVDLLSADQPLFSMASTNLDSERAAQLVRPLLRQGQTEAKYTKLRGSRSGQQALLQFFASPDLTPANAKMMVVDKRYYLITHLVDKLIEPTVYEGGLDLYAGDAHVGLVNVWYYAGHTIFPDGIWEKVLRAQGSTVMYLAVECTLAGLLAVSDPIKESTPEALAALNEAGMRVVVASGDAAATVKAVAERLKIDEYRGECKPADKLAWVSKLQSEGAVVAMAGDGINDAPALAKADVGIAMGTGTDVAMHSAQVTLVKGDLRGIARARVLSEATVRNMKQNLAWAFIYNALGVPLAAGVLYPLTGWLLSPMIAALAMSVSSASVITNALRLRGVRI